jgi:hypothetical protein
MSKQQKKARSGKSSRLGEVNRRERLGLWAAALGIAIVAAAGVVLVSMRQRDLRRASPVNASAAPSNAPVVANPELSSSEVAQALMVTVDLDFGGHAPAFKDALNQIERRHQPADGIGRTFSMLDAYGETNANGRLHISMHLSMEKPGIGSLIFRRTGEELWKSRIVPAKTGSPGPKNLTIIMDDHKGNSAMLDGTKGVTRVLDVPIHNSPSTVRDLWPDGDEREFTFIYSVCGCPVKAKVRRTGDTTARVTELPIMFPDDPAAMDVIRSLMGWPPER